MLMTLIENHATLHQANEKGTLMCRTCFSRPVGTGGGGLMKPPNYLIVFLL